MSILKEFKEFAVKGNVVDLAVGIIVGAAFNGVINSLVKDVIMPPIGLLLNKVDFSALFINLSNRRANSLADAQRMGIPTINYGLFINTLISFIITAFAVFIVVRWINNIRRRYEQRKGAVEGITKTCPFCQMEIPLKATRCPDCTSALS